MELSPLVKVTTFCLTFPLLELPCDGGETHLCTPQDTHSTDEMFYGDSLDYL